MDIFNREEICCKQFMNFYPFKSKKNPPSLPYQGGNMPSLPLYLFTSHFMKFYFILIGCLVGFATMLQFHAQLLPSRDTDVSAKQDYKEVYQQLQKEQNTLKTHLETLRFQEEEKNKFLSQNTQMQLVQAQKDAGFTKVQGEGVVIRLNLDGKVSSAEMASMLRETINLLLSLNAEAISVNGYRVVFKTPIISVGDHILLENFHITAPFEIQVVGGADFIISALEVKEGFKNVREAIVKNNLSMEVQKETDLEIPAYLY